MDGNAILVRTDVLIDGTGAPPVSDACILIEDGKIARAGALSEGGWPAGDNVEQIEAPAVIPGLIEIHAHIAATEDLDEFLQNGVTSVRDMGTALDMPILQIRDEVNRRERPGPRIFSHGVIIDGPRTTLPFLAVEVKNEAEAQAEVDRQVAAGVDGIKVYWKLPRRLMKVCIDRAREHNLPVAGHIGMLVGGVEGGQLGLDSIEHNVSFMRDLFPTPARMSIGTLLRMGFMDNPGKGVASLFNMWRKFKLDSPNINRIVEKFALTRAAFHPTVACFERFIALENESVRQDPKIALKQKVPEVKMLHDLILPQKWSEKDYSIGKAGLAKMLEFVYKMYRAGVRIGAGTDVNAPYVFPGESLHLEMELLARAGIPPLQAIQSATANNARTLRQDNLGVIAPGKEADLVLLNRDPSRDISATREILKVFKAGKECSFS